MWDRGCWDRERAGAGRGWGWKWESDWGPMFFGGHRGGRRHGRRGRMFEQGDLKFVILQMLDEKPRHGYEIIKDLEERSGGRYAPSPGTVYPTLTLLEEMGYATGVTEAGGKKVYAITDEGRKYLAENRSTVDDVLGRLGELGDSIFGDGVRPAHEAMGAVGRAYWRAAVANRPTPETITKITEILRRTAAELEGIGRTP
jgi:DNA-binding PadR family transcriptional regulator